MLINVLNAYLNSNTVTKKASDLHINGAILFEDCVLYSTC